MGDRTLRRPLTGPSITARHRTNHIRPERPRDWLASQSEPIAGEVHGAGRWRIVPALRIRCGEIPYTVVPGDAPVLIGRDLPAQIRADDPRVSPVHAQIAVDSDHWVIGDAGGTTVCSSTASAWNRSASATVTVRLGHAEGLVVTLTVDHATVGEEIEAGVARAGAAVEDRREEPGFTRRRPKGSSTSRPWPTSRPAVCGRPTMRGRASRYTSSGSRAPSPRCAPAARHPKTRAPKYSPTQYKWR